MAYAAALDLLRLPPAMRTLAYRYGRPQISGSGSRWRSRLPQDARPYVTVENADSNRMWAERVDPRQQSMAKTGSSNSEHPQSETKTDAEKRKQELLDELRAIRPRLKLTKGQEKSLDSNISQAAAARNPVFSLKKVLSSVLGNSRPRIKATGSTGEDPSAQHAPDLAVIRQTMSLPAPHEYGFPRVSRLIEAGDFEHATRSLCASTGRVLQAEVSHQTIDSGWLCRLQLKISGVIDETVYGSGISKGSAQQAAWLHSIARIHSRGVFSVLLEPRPGHVANKDRELKTLQSWKESLTAPTQEQYPGAPAALFDPHTTHAGFVTLYQRLGLPLRAEINYRSKSMNGSTLHHTTVKLQSPDSDEILGNGHGEDWSKRMSKQAAWFSALCNLHENGTLKDLLDNATSIVPTVLDKATLQGEGDAKTEIYNFAASLGQVPLFEISKPVPRTFRARKSKAFASLVQVTISLPQSGIKVTELGRNLREAEVAAAVSFKRAAENVMDGDHGAGGTLEAPSGFRLLNTDTAKQFFEVMREGERRFNIEVEFETMDRDGKTYHRAQLNINSEPQGPEVAMSTKKQAEELAYLVAAVGISKARPDTLEEFERRLKEGKGQILKPPPPIDLRMDPETLYMMRTALIDARAVGLPDDREILPAARDIRSDLLRRQRRPLLPEDAKIRSEMLAGHQKRLENDPELEQLRTKRSALPMSGYRDQVLAMVSNHIYSIVVGATGSGKTTQVPQILLEDYIAQGKGGLCNIVCTQPRRIAATSVAARVAAERAESLQQTVGYHVRFDARNPPNGGGITYCTTGILLEQLKHDPGGVLDTLSYIVIDEVHERDINIDFLMVVLKKALAQREANGQSVPKVVLMSATLDTELFANYFKQDDGAGRVLPAPSLSVPGRTYPVKEKFLGQIMDELKSYGPALRSFLAEDRVSEKYLRRELAFEAVGEGESAIDWKRERQTLFDEDEDGSAAQAKEDAWVPTALVASTIAHIARTGEEGAILAFLPGLEEITRTQRHLLDFRIFGVNFSDQTKFKVCLLHSSVAKEDQDEIFRPTPPGCRKIILSTNIAETSVTVTDVKHVVDTGKLRETRYDQVTRISGLQCVWESRSNAKQRAGRAGRVSEGNYYALYSEERYNSMKAVGLPELLRSDLQETCLAVRQQFPEDAVEDFLSQAIEPPAPRAVQAAISELKSIEAFTQDERLTALGRVLAKLPVHPSLGKMVVIGIVFRCLSPILLLSAAANERSLFVTGRPHCNARGFRDIAETLDRYGLHRAYARARENHIHFGAFKNIQSAARQIAQTLTDHGLLEADTFSGQRSSGFFGPDAVNQNSGNTALIKCLWLSGVYPNLAAKRYQAGMLWRTPSENSAMIHPSSINDDAKKKDRETKLDTGTLMTFSTLSRSTDGQSLYMRDTTVMHPLFAALFGGRLEKTDTNALRMDGWLQFYVKASDRNFATKLILETRKALDRALNAAFQALADVQPGQRTFLESDPVIDVFTNRIVEVLDRATGAATDHLWGDDAQRRALTAFGRAADGRRQRSFGMSE
ncbi:Helicase associated domain (HA2) [Teratosphaeria destructans]|uniref:RNA helicase n=1 Tax=Teratosphaeria destructans TaxID=418781 RepID=A0A9W7T0A1_9PEZI|nr:Helicase associated domain (HA2) [Teratosphaeria destructans]